MNILPLLPESLGAPVTERMHREFTQLRASQTVGEALDWLRQHQPPGRIIYFYVVDDEGRLQGVVPTRRLLLSPRATPLKDIMVGKVVTVPVQATVFDVCEFFIQYRLLAFPVVDSEHRVVGVVDIDLYTEALAQLEGGTTVGRLIAPLARFFRIEASGGVVLLAFTALALLLANSPWAAAFQGFWATPIGFSVGGFELRHSLLHWINDGLMTLFFFVVGLEIKREVTSGDLADPRKVLLPVVAALGGMVVPGCVYALLLWGRPGWHGWPVAMATDIAFVVGVLTLLGPRVPNGLKVLLLTLAIADDIGAIVVIAVVFTADLAPGALALASGGVGLIVLMQWLGVRRTAPYTLVGLGIWLAFLKSGVHPTVAGVILGLLTPTRRWPGRRVLFDVVSDLYGRMLGQRGGAKPEPISPLDRLEHGLHPWVAFVIMPVFALSNAGVTIDGAALATPVALGVAVALLAGKPAGILLFSWASVRLGWTRLPAGVSWRVLAGAGCLAGIGFTMSLFMASLAFDGPMRDQAKFGILAGSVLGGLAGYLLLLAFLPRRVAEETEAVSEGTGRH